MSKISPSAPRLDRLLANLGYGTRKDIQNLLKGRRIHLDGTPLDNPRQKIVLAHDLPERLSIDGKKLDPLPGLTLIINKPLGMTCSHKEVGPLIYDLLPARWNLRKPAISTVGRLDKDTSGLLLLTDDGALLHKIITPRSKIAKRYRATLARPLCADAAAIFASGTLMLTGEDKPLLPAFLEMAPPCDQVALEKLRQSVFLTITEGRYHQVRRMFAAIGNHVTALHRVNIGGLDLPDDLACGAYRLLSAAQIDSIFASSLPSAMPRAMQLE